jgi:hypothetical protein
MRGFRVQTLIKQNTYNEKDQANNRDGRVEVLSTGRSILRHRIRTILFGRHLRDD